MAKTNTTKTPDKRMPSRPVETVTMADLKRQQDRIETVLCQMSEFLREATDKAVIRIDHRTREDGKALKELYHTTNKIEREVSLIRSGASFMQELEKAKPTEEQGLEPGDYTDRSKEVEAQLLAMGYKRIGSWEDAEWNCIWVWYDEEIEQNGVFQCLWPHQVKSRTHYPTSRVPAPRRRDRQGSRAGGGGAEDVEAGGGGVGRSHKEPNHPHGERHRRQRGRT